MWQWIGLVIAISHNGLFLAQIISNSVTKGKSNVKHISFFLLCVLRFALGGYEYYFLRNYPSIHITSELDRNAKLDWVFVGTQ